ncbi:MAG: hypothetical protein C0501_12225 [Isosphaera sp.]|nr:hypothetical protein [Isosphaera sp.]
MRGCVRCGGGAVLVAVVSLAAVARLGADPPPNLLPQLPEREPVVEPPAPVDPAVVPAQLTTPAGPAAVPTAGTVPDPPHPAVRIQVRVPADAPPGDDLKYVITVRNTSAADAHAVTVRNPLPDGAKAVKAEPGWDQAASTDKQLVWKFGTLPAGKSKAIELTLRPDPKAAEVKNLAYVGFEHGQAVTTRVNKPAVKVTKVAPAEAVRDEPFTVRVAVDNTGRVPVEGVRVVENLPASAEAQAVTPGAKRTDARDGPAAGGQQWAWEVPRLLPGERKVIEYRVTPRAEKEVLALTNLTDGKGRVAEKAESRTKVLVAGLAVKLTGPPGNAPVAPGEAARYEIEVRNTGTLPSTNVRVTGTLPAGCRPTMRTEGGQLARDAVVWVIPRLEPGDARTFRFATKATTSGRREVTASAADARGQRDTAQLATVFQVAAALDWETVPNPVTLAVGRRGTFTVRVTNTGGEAARNVRVEVELPDAVALVQTTPTAPAAGNTVTFPAETVAADGEVVYTVSYEAKRPAQAWFRLRLTADALGDRPVQTDKSVEITGGGR